MKIRTGFVSNSSSSSFVCAVCGREESGWDSCASDFDMCTCRNCGRIFCQSEILKSPNFEDAKQEIVNYLQDELAWNKKHNYDYSTQEDGLEQLKETPAEEIDFTEWKTDDEEEVLAAFCPFCQNTEYDKAEVVKAFMKKYSLDKDGVLKVVAEYRETEKKK